MQYILNQTEVDNLKRYEREAERYACEIAVKNSVIKDLEGSLRVANQKVKQLEAQIAKLNLKLEAAEVALATTKVNVVTPKGADYDLDKVRVLAHLNEDGSVTFFNR